MADNVLEGTFSFEAGFKPATSGFAQSRRYTYGQCVCTRCKREFVLLALSCGTYPSTAAVSTEIAIRSRFQATKVCLCGVFSRQF